MRWHMRSNLVDLIGEVFFLSTSFIFENHLKTTTSQCCARFGTVSENKTRFSEVLAIRINDFGGNRPRIPFGISQELENASSLSRTPKKNHCETTFWTSLMGGYP